MRIVVMGTPEYAVPVLKEAAREHTVVGVYTQPDKPVGRKKILTAPPVKVCAEELGLRVFQPKRVKKADKVEELRGLNPDLILVAAYGQILSQEILDIPPLGCINLHASLLPKYRGASPIQRCIVNGDRITGVSVMQMDAGVDTGDVLLQRETAIGGSETAEELYGRLAVMAGELTGEILKRLAAEGRLTGQKQDESLATYAPMLSREDGLIDWKAPAARIYNQVRGLYPWPSAYTFWGDKKLTIWKAGLLEEPTSGEKPGTARVRNRHLYVACGDLWLAIENLQLTGKKQMNADAFLLGNHPDGAVFGA